MEKAFKMKKGKIGREKKAFEKKKKGKNRERRRGDI